MAAKTESHLKWTYIQADFGKSDWKPVLTSSLEDLAGKQPFALHTVLSTDNVSENTERAKIRYLGPLYFDWDSATIDDAIMNANAGMQKLIEMGVNPHCVRLYATGGRGFHAEVPMGVFMVKIPAAGISYLPAVYKELAIKLATDDLDLSIYSMGRGRMWRTANVQRDNGNYKVPISWDRLKEMDADTYAELCSRPRTVEYDPPELCAEMVALYDSCDQIVRSRISNLKPMKAHKMRELLAKPLPSLDALLSGRGIRVKTGFQELAVQVSILSHSYGWDEDEMIKRCAGLIENHESDSSRYSSTSKREKELRRMYKYMQDNPCYTFSVGALKSIMNHSADDLDGIETTKEEIEENIKIADADPEGVERGSYADMAGGVQVKRSGIYSKDDEGMTKRISAVSFDSITEIKDMGDERSGCVTQGYSAEVLLNGQGLGNRELPVDTFASSKAFNGTMLQYGVAAHINDHQVREVVNSMKDKATKKKRVVHITRREGLDILQVPMHEDPEMRAPFLAWADTRAVEVSPKAAFAAKLNLRMVPVKHDNTFNTDLSNAPDLAEWIDQDGAKQYLTVWLKHMLHFQRPSTVAKVLGWLVAAFYKPLFHEVYKQFPLLHVYGDAGTGKTASITALLKLHYFNATPTSATPSATMFGVQSLLACSMSIPLLLDEYKPHVMGQVRHESFKALFRDAYNSKEVVRGGGSDKDRHFSVITRTRLAAPIVYLGEYPENETAVAERSVFAPYHRRASADQMKSLRSFMLWSSNTHVLSMLGLYIARCILMRSTVEQFKRDFDLIHDEVVGDLMLPEDTTGMSSAEIEQRSKMTARPVFNLAVCRFGLSIFRSVLVDIYESDFGTVMGPTWESIERNVYTGVNEYAVRNMPEWAKVLNLISMLSNQIDPHPHWEVKHGRDYAILPAGGRTIMEIDPRVIYSKYRAYNSSTGQQALFLNDMAFGSSLLASPIYIKAGLGSVIKTGQGVTIDYDMLIKAGVDPFKN
jgi:hypothetical protein